MRMIGRQNLQLYKDWKGNEKDIAKEFELNKAIGLKYGAWKGGTLVADDEGLVAKAIEEQWPSNKKVNVASVSEENSSASTPLDDEDVEMEVRSRAMFEKVSQVECSSRANINTRVHPCSEVTRAPKHVF